METLLELQELSYSYHSPQGETKALDGVSFCVGKGEFVAVAGPSGCGKTTLMSLIAGLLVPESGSILLKDSASPGQKVRVGYMLQRDHLFEWRTIYQNVTLGLEINRCMTPKRLEYVNTLLREYGLEAFRDKHPGELSGGMKQRAALIRTLALNPDLLLLDEPFSALDYQTRLTVSADICRLIRATGKTVLLITHDLAEAISLADRCIVMTGRPARVKCEVPICLTVPDDGILSARSAPEFQHYFNLLWKEMSEDDEKHA